MIENNHIVTSSSFILLVVHPFINHGPTTSGSCKRLRKRLSGFLCAWGRRNDYVLCHPNYHTTPRPSKWWNRLRPKIFRECRFQYQKQATISNERRVFCIFCTYYGAELGHWTIPHSLNIYRSNLQWLAMRKRFLFEKVNWMWGNVSFSYL